MDFPFDIRWPLVGLLGCSAAINVVLVLNQSDVRAPVPVAEVVQQQEIVEPIAEPIEVAQDWKVLHLKVHRSLSQTFAKAEPSHGSALSAVYSRLKNMECALLRFSRHLGSRDLCSKWQARCRHRILDTFLRHFASHIPHH